MTASKVNIINYRSGDVLLDTVMHPLHFATYRRQSRETGGVITIAELTRFGFQNSNLLDMFGNDIPFYDKIWIEARE